MNRFLFLIVLFILYSISAVAQSEILQVGTATKVINNNVGGWVQGAGVARQASEIRDDLEANGIYLSKGDVKILIISCDLAVRWCLGWLLLTASERLIRIRYHHDYLSEFTNDSPNRKTPQQKI